MNLSKFATLSKLKNKLKRNARDVETFSREAIEHVIHDGEDILLTEHSKKGKTLSAVNSMISLIILQY